MCIENNLVDGKFILTDSTHIKANTSRKSEYLKEVEIISNEYIKVLDQYQQEVQRKLEKKGKILAPKSSKYIEKREIITKRESKTDPDSGFYKRKGKPEGMHYLSHQALDSLNGIIIDVVTTPGNVNDSQPYIEQLHKIEKTYGITIESACADSGYDTNLINQQLSERNINFYTPARST